MRNYDRQNRQGRQGSSYRQDEGTGSRRSQSNAGGRGDWYDRDPMDDRSGYRDEDQGYSRRMDAGDIRGYNDHYRYDQMYHSYYGSPDYNPDRERDFEGRGSRRNRGDSSYDSDRYSRGQGAYGTSSSGRASWDTDMNTDNNRWNASDEYTNRGGNYRSPASRDWSSSSGSNYGRQEDSSRTSQGSYGSSYGSNYGSGYGSSSQSWNPSSNESRSSFSGRGPKGFKRSDERIKEEVCEMLTRHNSIDADDIEVEVKDGEVTLSGSVTERRMKHQAEDLVEQCFGVKDVVNNIRVKKSEDSEVSDRTEFGSSSSRDRSLSASSAKKSGSTLSSGKTTENPNH